MAKSYTMPKGKPEKIAAIKALYTNGNPNISNRKLIAEIEKKTGVNARSISRYIADGNWQRIVNPEAQKSTVNKPDVLPSAKRPRTVKPKKEAEYYQTETVSNSGLSDNWNGLTLNQKIDWVQKIADRFMVTADYSAAICQSEKLPYALFRTWLQDYEICRGIWAKAIRNRIDWTIEDFAVFGIKFMDTYLKAISNPDIRTREKFTVTGVNLDGEIIGAWVPYERLVSPAPLPNIEIISKMEAAMKAATGNYEQLQITESNGFGELTLEQTIADIDALHAELKILKANERNQ